MTAGSSLGAAGASIAGVVASFFEEFESLNDAFDYYRDHREKSVKIITTARPVQE